MDYQENIEQAFTTLIANKLRTALAVLGIVIGIASVIALLSLGESSKASIQTQIQSLGSNLLTVNPGSSRAGSVQGGQGSSTTLTLDDAKAITASDAVSNVSVVSPEYSGRSQVSTSTTNTNTRVIGATDAYVVVHNLSVESGAFFTQTDNATMSTVAVLGPTTVTALFGTADPLNQSIRIAGKTFTVIGVTSAKGGTGFQNQDDVVYVPLLTAQRNIFGVKHVSSIALTAKSADVMRAAQDEVGYLLLARHGIQDPAQADFTIFSQQDILNTVSSVTQTFTTLLSGVAAISLIVGGIGIMNIMLVTVTERTREIGLRKALGAKKRTIIEQFLIESVLLTFAGGVFGIVIGVAISYVFSLVTKSVFLISFPSIGLACVVSAVIGLLFGWYPAKRAAGLQPIEALRYE